MLNREEHKQIIVGQYILTNPLATQDQIKMIAEGAVAMFDFLERKKREANQRNLHIIQGGKKEVIP